MLRLTLDTTHSLWESSRVISMVVKTILVLGTTGTQGSSVVSALLSLSTASTPVKILALTRNVSSAKAKSLVSDGHVHLLSGDPYTSLDTVFESANTPIDAMFLRDGPWSFGSRRGTSPSIVDASIRHRVKHIVFTSAVWGGHRVSDKNSTPVAHIIPDRKLHKGKNGSRTGRKKHVVDLPQAGNIHG